VPVLSEGLLHARWFNVFVVEFEIFFSFWLITGLLPKLTWLASIVLFSTFTIVSLFKAVTGEVSCGCFGGLVVNPWITTMFDIGVVGLLGISRPKGNFLCWVSSRSLLLYCGFCILTGVAVYAWISQVAFERLEQVGQVLEGNTVQLEPESWIGKEFPLRDYVVGGQDLVRGRWTLLLFRPGCSRCDEEKIKLSKQVENKTVRVAFLNITSKKTLPNNWTDIKTYQLTYNVSWVADTPVVIELQDGVVLSVDLFENQANTF
jgi:hypothetical protein